MKDRDLSNDPRNPDEVHADLYRQISSLRRSLIRSNFAWILMSLTVLWLLLTGCAAAGGGSSGTTPRKTPAVAPDPSPMGDCGRNRKSVLLYASWEHEYEKVIGYQDGTGALRQEFDQRAQTRTGGSVSLCFPLRPGGHYSVSVDRKRDREDRGTTTCWILWGNVIQDRDTRDNGSVECTWQASA